MNDFLQFAAAFILSLLATALLLWGSHRWHWLDVPNSRSSHDYPKATGGGIAFAGIFAVVIIYVFRDMNPGENFYHILVFSLGLAVMGLVDDVFHLGIWARIGPQIAVVAITLYLLGVPEIPLLGVTLHPGWFSYLMVAVALIWFINLFNFMDGIDGIAATEAIFVNAGILFITLSADNAILKTLLPVLIAVLGGFLTFNLPPSKIFMGDAGSNFLGYLLGVICMLSTTTGITNIWVWCILAGVFIMDATFTLLSRVWAGETWYHAHRSHAFQLAAVRFNSHGRVVLIMMGINLFWLLPLAWLAQQYADKGLLITILAWIPLAFLVWVIRKSSPSLDASSVS